MKCRNIVLRVKSNLFSIVGLSAILLALLQFYEPLRRYALFTDMSYTRHILNCFPFNTFMSFAPIIVSIVASTNFCDDLSSGYIISSVVRQSKKRYMANQYLTSTFTGGILMSFITTILMIVIFIMGKPRYLSDVSVEPLFYDKYGLPIYDGGAFDKLAFESIQYIWGGVFVAIVIIFLAFIFGAIWANVGLAFSTFVPNKYLTMAFPLFLYFLINNLFHRFEPLVKFTPINTIVPGATVIPSTGFILTEQLIFFTIVSLIYFFGANRRLKNV